MPYDASYHVLYRAEPLRRALDEMRPDVLEVHSPYAAALLADRMPRAWYGVRTFLWHSDFIDTYERVLLSRAPALVRRATTAPLWSWARHIARRSDAVFVATKHLYASLSAHGFRNLVHLPFGVDTRVFHPRPTGEASAPPQGAPRRLVTIGRLAVEKRVDVVLDAFRILVSSFPDLTLDVIGDGPERAKLEKRVEDLPQVRFSGFEKDRSALARTLRESALLLHACPYETFGLGVAEALACGLPAVLPDEGGAAEWDEGPSRVLHRSLDPQALAAAARDLLQRITDHPDVVRDDAIAFGSRVLSIESHFARLLEHYEELLSVRRRFGETRVEEDAG